MYMYIARCRITHHTKPAVLARAANAAAAIISLLILIVLNAATTFKFAMFTHIPALAIKGKRNHYRAPQGLGHVLDL